MRLWGPLAAALSLGACGGGGDGGGVFDGGSPTGDDGTTFASPIPFPPAVALTAAEVELIVAQAAAEASARGAPANIVVVDRVGNVLAAFAMTGAPTNLAVVGRPAADGSGLDGLNLPGDPTLPGANIPIVGAIAKAITGAYLSSNGNAFTTRTASQIVQENFNPGEAFQAGGPLFGVQFSQLPCSDLNTRFATDAPGGAVPVGSLVGPKRSPLGLSADPGGLPIYKNGVMAGGVGVIADGVYGLDPNPRDVESQAENVDELIALAATIGFTPPEAIEAPRITVEGKSLRYTDEGLENDRAKLLTAAAPAPPLAAVPGQFVDVAGYFLAAGGARDGAAYGAPASGYVPATSLPGGSPFSNPNAFVLVDGAGQPRFSPKPGGDGDRLPVPPLSQVEVIRLIDEALGVALAGRAQIRRPLNSRIQVTVSVVDTNGEILGVARTPDGPIFGTDVSLQKARTAMFFSSASAGAELSSVPGVDSAQAFFPIPDPFGGPDQRVVLPPLDVYVQNARAFLGPDALTGRIAFSDRGNGNLSRPFFPDGINGEPPGPFSRPFNAPDTTQNWSPFSTGLQFDLVGADILQHVLFILGAAPDADVGCTMLPPRNAMAFPFPPLANGAQIFAGSVPIYRGDVLIGGIGVSGDGIDQDDMISSLGLRRAGLALATGIGHAPEPIRSDTLTPQGVRLRYVSCPFQPFISSDAQNVCEDL